MITDREATIIIVGLSSVMLLFVLFEFFVPLLISLSRLKEIKGKKLLSTLRELILNEWFR